jgi:hypothetical protein
LTTQRYELDASLIPEDPFAQRRSRRSRPGLGGGPAAQGRTWRLSPLSCYSPLKIHFSLAHSGHCATNLRAMAIYASMSSNRPTCKDWRSPEVGSNDWIVFLGARRARPMFTCQHRTRADPGRAFAGAPHTAGSRASGSCRPNAIRSGPPRPGRLSSVRISIASHLGLGHRPRHRRQLRPHGPAWPRLAALLIFVTQVPRHAGP